MEDKKFKVIIVEDVKLELKGTEEIFRHEIPNAEVIGTAMTEQEFWTLIEAGVPDLVLLDLGLGGSTTIGVDICRNIFKRYPGVHVLIFTGEILNEKLWVDVLEAGADGIILKTGELLTKTDVQAVMDGKKLVFNYPILEKIVERFKKSVLNDAKRQEAIISYDIDEYDERFLRHLGDGGYIILLPIAAMLFQWVGLHPLAGIITAYVSVACGYSANIVLSTMDPLLAHTTQEAALAQTGYQGNTEPLCNYFFMSASTVVITAIVYWLTQKWLLPELRKI